MTHISLQKYSVELEIFLCVFMYSKDKINSFCFKSAHLYLLYFVLCTDDLKENGPRISLYICVLSSQLINCWARLGGAVLLKKGCH